MSRIIIASLLILTALPAAAQSRSETFSTRYDSEFDGYMYEATYEFSIPPYTRDSSIQNALASEVLVDLYWNTTRVWLVEARIECWNDTSGRRTLYADRVATDYFMNLRTTVFSDECRLRLVYLNHPSDRYRNSSQRASMRLKVSSTTGGNLRLTKTRNPLSFTGAPAYTSAPQSDRQALRERMAALQAAVAEQ